MKTIIFTSIALIAFAANSVLCRLALDTNNAAIDAASFTSIRLLSGVVALMLLLLVTVFKGSLRPSFSQFKSHGSWMAAAMLFVYAATFSYAYISLKAGTGALILFALVQITMITHSLFKGLSLTKLECFGVALAFLGLAYLLSPGVAAPSFSGFLLMSIAGIAWGVYTVLGKGSNNPLADTAVNFLRTLPFVIVLAVLTFQEIQITREGVYLAVASGAFTSGVGYAIWYAALKGLSSIQAGTMQLLVPIIAIFGGILFANEALSMRLMLSTLIILGGITMVLLASKLRTSKA